MVEPTSCACGGSLKTYFSKYRVEYVCERCGFRQDFLLPTEEIQHMMENPPVEFDPYNIQFSGRLDPYQIADLYGLDGMQTQALKKLLRNGRKHKTEDEDMYEVISTLQRRKEILELRRKTQGVSAPKG